MGATCHHRMQTPPSLPTRAHHSLCCRPKSLLGTEEVPVMCCFPARTALQTLTPGVVRQPAVTWFALRFVFRLSPTPGPRSVSGASPEM